MVWMVKNMTRTEYLGPAWGNWKLENKCIMKTGLVGGKKLNPDIWKWVLTGNRTMPGMHLVSEHDTEQDALNLLRMLVGV